MLEKLKNKWGIESNFQVIIILIVFAITGSSAAKISDIQNPLKNIFF